MSATNHTDIAVGAAANASVINTPLGQLDAAIGDLTTLPTTPKASVVGAIGTTALGTAATTISGAIAEHEAQIGDLTALNTTVKSSVVGAINELDSAIDALVSSSGDDIAEIVAARGGYPTLDDRLDTLAVATGIAGGQTINGGSAANDDLELNGTGHATKASSYVLLQTNGGNVGIGTLAPGQALDIAYGNLRFTPVTDAGAPTVALAAGGSVTDGAHYYKISFVTAEGETYVGAGTTPSALVTCGGGNNTVNLTNIPVSPSFAVTSRKLYRTKAGGSTYWLVATIADNTTTTYSDTVADAALTGEIATYRENTTAGRIYTGTDQAGIIGAQGVIGFGYRALRSFTTGIRNTALGGYALELTTTGSENAAVGTHALNNNTTGSSNAAHGFYAGEKNTTGGYNVAIGAEALRSNLTGSANVAIGYRAANAILGTGNTAVGYRALALGTGGFNVAIGSEAGYNETGSNKLFIDNQQRGSEANGRALALVYGQFAPSPLNQTFTINGRVGIGTIAPGQALDIAYGNLRFTPVTDATAPTVAVAAGGSVTDGAHYYRVTFVTATGETTSSTATSLVATTGGGNNTVNLTGIPVSTAINVTSRKIYRTKAGGSTYWLVATIADNTTTTYSDTADDAALTDEIAAYRENTTAARIYSGTSQIGFIGPQSTVALGFLALSSFTSGVRNSAIGAYALQLATTGSQNAAVGTHALNNTTTGSNNVAVGFYAGEKNTTGTLNTALGAEAMRNNLVGAGNVAVGFRAACNATGGENTAVGDNALYTNTTGNYNVCIGNRAGYYETGSNKLFIDNAARASEADGRAAALIYGIFGAAVANQELTFNAGKMGFFGTAAVAKPTGVAVDAAGIHAALVTLGLIAA